MKNYKILTKEGKCRKWMQYDPKLRKYILGYEDKFEKIEDAVTTLFGTFCATIGDKLYYRNKLIAEVIPYKDPKGWEQFRIRFYTLGYGVKEYIRAEQDVAKKLEQERIDRECKEALETLKKHNYFNSTILQFLADNPKVEECQIWYKNALTNK